MPLGHLTDRFGGRVVFFLLMLSTVLPIYLMEYATAYWHFLAIGLFVILAGGSFRWHAVCGALVFPRQARPGHGRVWRGQPGRGGKQIRRPALIAAGGWMLVPKVYAGVMLVTAILFWLFSA